MEHAHHDHINHFPYLYHFLWGYTALLFIVGLSLSDWSELLSGLWLIVSTEDALITDYIRVPPAEDISCR